MKKMEVFNITFKVPFDSKFNQTTLSNGAKMLMEERYDVNITVNEGINNISPIDNNSEYKRIKIEGVPIESITWMKKDTIIIFMPDTSNTRGILIVSNWNHDLAIEIANTVTFQ